MLRRLAPLPLLGLLLSGCCGGYAVVRTTVADHAQLKDQGAQPSEGGSPGAAEPGAQPSPAPASPPTSAVLHYSRLGEPPNSCGSEVKYLENLWLQVPSLTAGQAYTIGAPGVVAAYSRQQGEATIRSSGITGRVEIKGQTSDGLNVLLTVTITLPSGETVTLDDDYAFHPMSGGHGPPETAAAQRVWSSCRAAM